MRKCRSEFGRKIFSISRAIITTVLPTVRLDFYWRFRFGNCFCGLAEFGAESGVCLEFGVARSDYPRDQRLL